MADITFRTSRGGDPVAHIRALKAAAEVTTEDLLYAGQRQRTRILDRTRAGVDVDGVPFAPYSTKGPYYYNPSAILGGSGIRHLTRQRNIEHAFSVKGASTGREIGSLKGRAKRLLKKLGGETLYGSAKSLSHGEMRLSKSGQSIRFESYAAFKAWLGRTCVDLTGPRAPHMLQAIQTKVEGLKMLVLGIYGPKADIAQGHNEGARNLPQRHFFGASYADLKQMACDIGDRVAARMKRA